MKRKQARMYMRKHAGKQASKQASNVSESGQPRLRTALEIQADHSISGPVIEF